MARGFERPQSVVNDKIKQIDRDFDITQTNFQRFSDLAKIAEESGHITLGRKKETLHIESSKYYDENAPPPVRAAFLLRDSSFNIAEV